MADLAKYQQDIKKFNTSYAKEAVKEPFNFWGLAGFAVAAAFTGSVSCPCSSHSSAELVYIMVVPNLPMYRQLVQKREKDRRLAAHKSAREKLIKSFTPREREAVEYLRWLKEKIQDNYKKFTGAGELALKPVSARPALGRFCRPARRLPPSKTASQSRSIARQFTTSFRRLFVPMETSTDEKTKRIQQTNVEILKRRVASFDEIERSVKLVEGQLQSIENFFSYLNDEIVTISTPEKFSLLDFEQLSDSIAMTKQMLDATADERRRPRQLQPRDGQSRASTRKLTDNSYRSNPSIKTSASTIGSS